MGMDRNEREWREREGLVSRGGWVVGEMVERRRANLPTQLACRIETCIFCVPHPHSRHRCHTTCVPVDTPIPFPLQSSQPGPRFACPVMPCPIPKATLALRSARPLRLDEAIPTMLVSRAAAIPGMPRLLFCATSGLFAQSASRSKLSA